MDLQVAVTAAELAGEVVPAKSLRPSLLAAVVWGSTDQRADGWGTHAGISIGPARQRGLAVSGSDTPSSTGC